MINRVILLFALSVSITFAQSERQIGGTIEAEIDGRLVYFPLLNSDISADIQGDLATVKITQTFQNPSPEPLNARYLFPMNKDSAVYAMTMEVGDRITRAVIKRKEEARATFEQAKAEGKAASLLTQHRPNMFTQEVANLMPGLPVKITIKYSQVVPKKDGDYELVIPLIVGPRYQPMNAGLPPVSDLDGKAQDTSTSEYGAWQLEQLPNYPLVNGVTLPKTVDADRVAIAINMQSDLNIESVYSDTHSIISTGTEKSTIVNLSSGSTIDNKDFVLRYGLAGEAVQAGFLSTLKEEEGGFFSLLIEPPAMPEDADIQRREMVFVLDTSGSMRGQPLDASKSFMHHALDNLRSGDFFRIISFNNAASEYRSAPQAATLENIRSGLDYIEGLRGGGGTEIATSITQAFSVPPKAGTVRIVVFLTDGYIGNEQQIFAELDRSAGDARIFAFGVGTSVNRYLLSEMGRRGRGFARFIDPTENADDVAISLASKLNAPVLTNISVDFGDMEVSDLTPAIIPDLFSGDSIRVQGKFTGSGTKTIRVKGNVGGRDASLPMQIKLAEQADPTKESIPIIWARSMVADKMRQFSSPNWTGSSATNKDQLKAEIIKLGLSHALVTQWTSFVAVDEKIINENPESTKTSDVVLPKVEGVENSAYGDPKNNLSVGLASAHGDYSARRSADAGIARLIPQQMAGAQENLADARAGVRGRTAYLGKVAPSPAPEASNSNTQTNAQMPAPLVPEPGAIGGLLLMSLLGFFAIRRGKRG